MTLLIRLRWTNEGGWSGGTVSYYLPAADLETECVAQTSRGFLASLGMTT